MRKIRKAKVLNNGSPLISDSLINVPTSSRGNIVAHCNFAFSDETLTRTITVANANNNKHREAIQYTKRRFRDSQETIEMLKDAMLENFTDAD